MASSKRLASAGLLFLVASGAGTWGAAAAAPAARIDGAALIAAVRTLASPELEGRRTGSPGGLKARAYITGRFKAIGLDQIAGTYLMPFRAVSSRRGQTTEELDAANVMGRCRGTGPARDVMVISAHYDHLGVRNGVMYPGADDNASGVAAMLELAAHCRRRPFVHDAILVAFDAEELGLQGAKAFVSNPPVPLDGVRFAVNLDMVSRNDRRELFAAGTYHWPQARPPLEAVARRAAIRLRFGHDRPRAAADGEDDWTQLSDQGAFHAAGMPFVYFGVEDHADYHKPTDTADKIDVEFFRQAVETILDAIIALDRARF